MSAMRRLLLLRHCQDRARRAGRARPRPQAHGTGPRRRADHRRIHGPPPPRSRPRSRIAGNAGGRKPGRSSLLASPRSPGSSRTNASTTLARKRSSASFARRAARSTLLVVGHNPGLHDLAVQLIASGDVEARERVTEKLPTSGLVVIDFPFDDWSQPACQCRPAGALRQSAPDRRGDRLKAACASPLIRRIPATSSARRFAACRG